MSSKEEIEKAKTMFKHELDYEIQVYDIVNDYSKIKTDNHKILYEYIQQLETEAEIN